MSNLRLVMMGTGMFAEPTFEALFTTPHQVVGLITQPDRAMGQERGSTRQVGRGLKAIAQEHSVAVFQPDNINTPEGVAILRELRPELLVVAAYGQILSKDVLAVPEQGGINVHASLLPKYRGAAPVAWAIYHGECESGVTIIKMSVSLDAGDMLAQGVVTIGPEETSGELESRLAVMGSRLAVQVIDQIAAGTTHGIKQDKSLATKAPKLTKEHGQIDWTRAAREVCNQVRAMHPWPTAYTYLHRPGQPPMRIIVHKASSSTGREQTAGRGSSDPALAGRIHVAGTSLRVSVGKGETVEILELQPAGKRRMLAGEFLRGHRPHVSDYFGPEKVESPSP